MKTIDKDTLKNTDILERNETAITRKIDDDVTYIYAYKFKNGVSKKARKRFSDTLKYSVENTDLRYSDEWFDFVEDGIFCLGTYKRFETFKVMVMPKNMFSNKYAVMRLIGILIMDYSVTGFITIDRLKKRLEECACGERKKDEEIEHLKAGTEVLLCDYFRTPKPVISKLVELIKSVNPNNKLTLFVFIDG